MNVVSTVPSATEILYSLGVEPVAVSHACDYPAAVNDLPRIDANTIGGTTSAERDAQTATASGFDVDAETLRSVDPDLIITQTVCGVCAVDRTAVEEVLDGFDADPAIISLNPRRLSDLFECIKQVAAAMNSIERGEELVTSLRDRLAKIEERSPPEKPRVAVIEWMDPIHVGANWVPEIVQISGGRYGLAAHGERSEEVEWAEIVDYAPEVLIIAPCGYNVDRIRDRFEELRDRPGWRDLPAVERDRVYGIDGSRYLTRWSPRLVDAAERVAAVIHPSEFGPPPDDVEPLVTPVPS